MHKVPTIKKLTLILSLSFLVACQQLPRIDKAPEAEAQSESTPVEQAISTGSQACECPAVEQQQCPEMPAVAPKPTRPKLVAARSIDELQIIGRVENVFIQSNEVKLKARIDSGAGLTSLHAAEVIEFERDGESWIKFIVPVKKHPPIKIERPIERYVEIKLQNDDTQRRPVVIISIKLGEIEEQVEVTLTDRSDYVYPVLIGRNFLRDRAIVDVSRKFTAKYPN